MTAAMMPPSSAGSFLDSPTFSHTNTSLTGFQRRSTNLPRTALRFDISGLEEDTDSSCRFSSKLNTPDSGFFGAASNTPLKTPESDISPSAVTPPSGGSCHRKRKTVTIDESQTSIVVISPDDLFNTYSKLQGQSLESRDNPFLPGGELSREAEDLLSRATIIRDHFYLNEDEKRTLREHQQQQQQHQQQQLEQQRSSKHVHILDHADDVVASSGAHKPAPSPSKATDERISPAQANNVVTAAPTSSINGGGDSHRTRENGKAKAATDNDKLEIPRGESLPAGQGQTDRPGTGIDVPVSGAGEVQMHEADKKRRNKCCSIM